MIRYLNINIGSLDFSGSTQCMPCPKGYACPLTTSDYRTPCPKGLYSVGEQSVCTECPAGMYCPTTMSNNELECPSGTFSVGNQSSCTFCPEGFECPTRDVDSRLVFKFCFFYFCLTNVVMRPFRALII